MLRREFLILWLLIVYSRVLFCGSLACFMLAMIFDRVSTILVLSTISCFVSGHYWIIPYSVGLLDSFLYGYSGTRHSSRSWFRLICFKQRLIAVSWSWSNLIHIANQFMRLFWYSPILVLLIQTWGFSYQLTMPANRVAVLTFSASVQFSISKIVCWYQPFLHTMSLSKWRMLSLMHHKTREVVDIHLQYTLVQKRWITPLFLLWCSAMF